jgi:hypothetical protein
MEMRPGVCSKNRCMCLEKCCTLSREIRELYVEKSAKYIYFTSVKVLSGEKKHLHIFKIVTVIFLSL